MKLVADPSDPTTTHLMTSRWNSFGQTFDNLEIDGIPAPYEVMNERAVRATAGVMLLPAIAAVVWAYFEKVFWPIEILVVLYLYDFIARQATGMTPLSPFGVIGTLLVKNQRPEWVGATQKRFAWAIGVIVASIVTVLIYSGVYGFWPLFLCGICMVFMWMEAALGICVGCKIYGFLVNRGWIKQPEVAPACPGGVCAMPTPGGSKPA